MAGRAYSDRNLDPQLRESKHVNGEVLQNIVAPMQSTGLRSKSPPSREEREKDGAPVQEMGHPKLKAIDGLVLCWRQRYMTLVAVES